MTEALSADEMSALYQKMQASPALYGDDMHRLMHTAQQVEGRAANLFTRLCAAETAIEQLQRTRNVMEPAPVRFDFEAENLRQQLDGLRRAYDHACAQRDKYMRRTIEWRSASLDGFDMPEDDAVAMVKKARELHGPVTIEGRLSPCCKASHGPALVSWPCVDARALGMVDEDDA